MGQIPLPLGLAAPLRSADWEEIEKTFAVSERD